MTVHTLQIFNQSGFAKSYVVFMTPPIASTGGDAPQVFTNAWVTFDSVTSGGFDSISFDDQVYAYWGTTPDTLAPGTSLTSGGVALVDLSQQNQVNFSGGSPMGFGAVTSGKTQPGAFAIVAGADFTPAAGFVFGWAKGAATPIPVPVATLMAAPNMIYEIAPITSRFYVVEASSAPGQVIDTTLNANLAVVDFTGLPQNTATVTHEATGVFRIQYSH